jgi:hypothetical protein
MWLGIKDHQLIDGIDIDKDGEVEHRKRKSGVGKGPVEQHCA